MADLYIIMGLWQDPASQDLGLRSLGDSLHLQYPQLNVHYSSYQDDVTSLIASTYNHESIIMVGHSLGGGKVIQVCNDLNTKNIPVQAIVILEPVPQWDAEPFNNNDFIVPDNVQSASCFYRNRWFFSFPFSFPIKKCNCPYFNYPRNVEHSAICSLFEVQQDIRMTVDKVLNS